MRLLYSHPFAPIQSLFTAVLQAKPVLTRAAGKLLQTHFRQSFESSPESRGSQTSGVLFGSFCTTQKERKNVPFAGSFEVLQTLNQRTAAAASHRNN
ncbi:MAG: hypothetical protein ACOYIO_07265 [Eubacteriales bacterium]